MASALLIAAGILLLFGAGFFGVLAMCACEMERLEHWGEDHE